MDYRQDNNANIALADKIIDIAYEGKVTVDKMFPCEVCDKISKFKYLQYRHPAIQHLFTEEEKIPMKICRACAKREIGSKNKKGWERLHGEK